jgi:release factor glutamine methyltransferase
MSRERLSSVRARLRAEASQRGVDPRDVDLLLADSVGRPVSFVLGHGELEIDPEAIAASLKRRFAGEPLQYIRQRTDFYGREFYVDDRVLIPRPETELLVEAAVKRAPHDGRVIDVGAGSGAIAVSVAIERPDLRVMAGDASVDALAVTALNRTRLGARVELVASDVLSAIRGSFDMILSNPPYIPEGDMGGLQVEVREHEPRRALTPGPAGTEIIERLLFQSKQQLAPGGRVMFEIGYGQVAAVRDLATASGFVVDDVIADLAGIPRTVVLSRHGQQ